MNVREPKVAVIQRPLPECAVTRLMLTNFRSYGMLDLKCERSHVVLVGPNGAGKTNVLEALSMFAPGRGLRGARLGELSRAPAHAGDGTAERPWAISATVSTTGTSFQVGVGFLPGRGEGDAAKRTVRMDGVPVAGVAELAQHVRLIWLSPSMDRIFVEGVSERRRFLDRLIASFDPLHARRWNRYETAMRERIGALRTGAGDAWLSALEQTMAETGVAVSASRVAGLSQLAAAMDQQVGTPFPRADMALAGFVEQGLATLAAVDVEDAFIARLRASRGRDLDAGRTHEGPHATDFLVSHREKGRAADSCSTGEQKALLIRLVLASASLPAPGAPEKPVLLLDEVAAHLDETRRRALFDEIEGLGVQAWLTGTEAPLFSGLEGRAQFMRVADGQVRPF
jgi:DNA replication and repair protein RecF